MKKKKFLSKLIKVRKHEENKLDIIFMHILLSNFLVFGFYWIFNS
jgi:hypothetical protein